VFEGFHGNPAVCQALDRMISGDRLAQTLLFAGPEGVGKATLARRFAVRLLGDAQKIERDDLSLEANRALIAEREKWPSEKRSDDPLLFSAHPDFLTFCPEGPLRQISIQQMRLLKNRAQFKPLKGRWRVFLIDQIDRANDQAADSLLKTLEEPPDHLVVVLTAGNPYDLPPTIRSRAVQFHLTPLPEAAMRAFAQSRGIEDPRRLALAGGCPGLAVTLDLEVFEKRRALLLALLETAAGQTGFAAWVKQSESFLASKSEKLDLYLKVLYALLEDLLLLAHSGHDIRNGDLRPRLETLARRISFDWLIEAVRQADALAGLLRRNVQKGLIVDSFALSVRRTLG
jgi:DNA polymerase-3 subunit delta'